MSKNEMIQFVDGELKLDVKVDLEKDTVWLNQKQIAELFNIDRTVVGRHIRNIFKSGELDEESMCANFAHMGKLNLQDYNVKYYSLDVILAVGYRTNSKQGIAFRKWASKVLKDYMVQGYAVNEKRLAALQRKLEVHKSLISGIADMAGLEANDILQVIETYSQALDLLDDYDHQRIIKPQGRDTIAYLTEDECREVIQKTKFSKQSDLFGKERSEGLLKGILDQIQQNVFGRELYPTLEEKAANLLYMLVKDHIYFDGNKRLAAILFLEFLNRNHALFDVDRNMVLSNDALVAITLMIVESKPEEKEMMVDIVMNLLVPSII